jgi:16S rRNA (cytidine1402-2'-O)-methyltransferase
MAGTLILCATPIGNLGDISSRLAETLASADVIYAEDTRRTSQLLTHLGLSKTMRSFFAGNERMRLDEIKQDLEEGSIVVLVSDAGMPVISDPGASAVQAATEVGAVVSAIPGPSAVTMALAVSGFDGDRFVFGGFLPRKGRDRTLAIGALAVEERTVVLFAAPSRVDRDLADLAEHIGGDRRVVIGRELTKLHEEVWRGTLEEAAVEFSRQERRRGEFTVVIAGADPVVPDVDAAVVSALEAIDKGTSMSDAVRAAAAAFGVSRREVYDRVVKAGPKLRPR